MDLEKSFLAVRQHHARYSAPLRAKLGRELTAGEYYLGHQQGWGGATALLSHPKDNVVDALATIMKREKAEKRSMLQGLLNDTDGSYAKKLLANNREEVASFGEKIQGRIEQTKLQELTEREGRNTLQQEEQQRNFSRSV